MASVGWLEEESCCFCLGGDYGMDENAVIDDINAYCNGVVLPSMLMKFVVHALLN